MAAVWIPVPSALTSWVSERRVDDRFDIVKVVQAQGSIDGHDIRTQLPASFHQVMIDIKVEFALWSPVTTHTLTLLQPWYVYGSHCMPFEMDRKLLKDLEKRSVEEVGRIEFLSAGKSPLLIVDSS